jgi:3-oxoacyl-[acyl-carrier protein] reductase
MNLSLKTKRALVGGSSQGIGLASAIALAGLGAEVTLLARNPKSLAAAALALPKLQAEQHHDYLVADFAEPEALHQTITEYLAQTGRTYHILVNNTGGPPGGPITESEVAEFMRAYQMHLACNQYLSQAVLPGMENAGYGRIINVISTSVKIPIAGLGVSNTTRGAVASWAKTWANEVAAHGITVNNVLPGMTDTGRLRSLIGKWASERGISEEEMTDQLKGHIPARRIAEPAEVAHAVAFLASPAASYINGINLPVDGGRTGAL